MYLQTLAQELRTHTHMQPIIRGWSLKPKFSTWFERSSPWGDLASRPKRSSPSGLVLGFFCFMGIGPDGLIPPPSPRVDFLSASSCCCVNYT